MYYIGVDLGTSAVKLILMAEDGSLRNIQSCEYPLFFPENGWSEQNPADWWNAVVKGIHKLCFDISPDQVAGISFGGQMHGLVALDASDQVIRPAILWNDGRTEEETRYLNEEIGTDKLAEYTVCRLYRSQTSLDAETRAGTFCPDPEDHAAKGLPVLPHDRRSCH